MTADNGSTFGSTRRQFIQSLGAAVGGVVLTGVGVGEALGAPAPPGQTSGLAAIPSGYAFYRIWTANNGAPTPGNPGQPNPIGDLSAVVMMAGATPLVYLHGTLTAAATPSGIPNNPPPNALFVANVNYSQVPPTLTSLRLVACEGQSLDGSKVTGAAPELLPVRLDRLGTGDTNSVGHYATTISSQDLNATAAVNSAPGVFLYSPETDRWSQQARLGDSLADGSQYGGLFGDVSVADDDSVYFSAGTTQTTTGFGGSQNLMVASPGSGPEHHAVLLRTGDLLPGTNAVVDGIGLIDTSSDGGFVVQVFASRRTGRTRRLGTALLQGNIRDGGRGMQLLAASDELVGPGRRDITVGETIMGPRIARNGLSAYVTHGGRLASTQVLTHRLRQRRLQVHRTGSRLRGMHQSVAAVSAPVVSDAALTYDTVLLDDGSSVLTVSDGLTSQVLLRSGDDVQGLKITEILHGYHPREVDGASRLAFAAEFLKNASASPTDPNNVLTALVVGVPL
jgi:hypothetical protein